MDPYAEFQQPSAANPYAEFQRPKSLPGNPTAEMRPLTTLEQLTAIKPITSKMPLSESIPTFVGDIGAAGIQTLAHPLDTAKGVISSLAHPGDTLRGMYEGLNTRPAETIAQGIGQAGALEPVGMLAPKSLPGMKRIGEAAQESGVGLMNKTGGMLKPDFKRGANPGKAYLDAGGGPALSMQSLSDKSVGLKRKVGSNIGGTITDATNRGVTIPANSVMAKMAPAIKQGMDLELGEGGLKNTKPIEDYASSFTPAFEEANGTGFTPSRLFDIQQRIGKNTNWAEPSQFNLKSIRQQNTAALSGLLNETLPDLVPLKEQYQGLKNFANRTQSRAETHSMPLTSIALKTGLSATGAGVGTVMGHPLLGALAGMAVDSVPFKSTLATGLYRGGKGLVSLGDGVLPVPRLHPAAAAIPGYRLPNSTKKQNDDDSQ